MRLRIEFVLRRLDEGLWGFGYSFGFRERGRSVDLYRYYIRFYGGVYVRVFCERWFSLVFILNMFSF